VFTGLSYGKRAQEAINKAVDKDPKSPAVYVARGVGNYYLPAPWAAESHWRLGLSQGHSTGREERRGLALAGPEPAQAEPEPGSSRRIRQSARAEPESYLVKQQLDKTRRNETWWGRPSFLWSASREAPS